MNEAQTKNINTLALIGCHITWLALDLFVSTFLVAELLYETGNNFALVGLFFAVAYIFYYIFYIVFAYLLKRFSSAWCMRLGIAVYMLCACLLIPLHDDIADFYLLFALISGVASGIFWISINNFTSNAISGGAMLNFQTYALIAQSFAKIVFPIALGAVITYVSFFAATIVAICIGGGLILCSMILRGGKPAMILQDASSYSMRRFFDLVKREKLEKPVMLNLAFQFCRVFFLLTAICTTILISMTFGDSFSLGYLTSIFSACAISVLTAYRFIKNRRVKDSVYLASAVLAFLLPFALIFDISKLTVILFQFAAAVCMAVPLVETGRMQFNVMKELGYEDMDTQSLLMVETAYMPARLLICGLIVLGYHLCIHHHEDSFSVIIVVMMGSALVSYFIFKRWRKLYSRKPPVR